MAALSVNGLTYDFNCVIELNDNSIQPVKSDLLLNYHVHSIYKTFDENLTECHLFIETAFVQPFPAVVFLADLNMFHLNTFGPTVGGLNKSVVACSKHYHRYSQHVDNTEKLRPGKDRYNHCIDFTRSQM